MITPRVRFLSARLVVVLVTIIVVVVTVPLMIVAIHANAVSVSGGPDVHQSAGAKLDATTKGQSAGDDGAKSQSADEGDDGE